MGIKPMTLVLANLYFNLCRLSVQDHITMAPTPTILTTRLWSTGISRCQSDSQTVWKQTEWGGSAGTLRQRERDRQVGDADKNTGSKIDTVMSGAFRAHGVDIKAWDQWCESDPLLCVSHIFRRSLSDVIVFQHSSGWQRQPDFPLQTLSRPNQASCLVIFYNHNLNLDFHTYMNSLDSKGLLDSSRSINKIK